MQILKCNNETFVSATYHTFTVLFYIIAIIFVSINAPSITAQSNHRKKESSLGGARKNRCQIQFLTAAKNVPKKMHRRFFPKIKVKYKTGTVAGHGVTLYGGRRSA